MYFCYPKIGRYPVTMCSPDLVATIHDPSLFSFVFDASVDILRGSEFTIASIRDFLFDSLWLLIRVWIHHGCSDIVD